jgi:branched-chain amino acid transport system ATP-binding protein
MLEIKDLHVNYGAVQALDGISFSVGDGRSGQPHRGQRGGQNNHPPHRHRPREGGCRQRGVRRHGADEDRPSRIISHGLAHVPEGRHIFPQMSVEENLQMGAFSDPSLTAEMIPVVYERFPRLKERHRQQAGTLSGGEQQMLAVGRALMSKPKMMLLDEPSMGLSPILVGEIFDIIVDLNKTGITILLVEQNAKMALAISNRAYVLETGHITIQGKASDLLQDERVRKAYLGQ